MGKGFFLGFSHFFLHFFTAPYNIQGRPGEQGRRWVKITGIDFTAQASCFKGNAATSAKGIAHARRMAQLLFAHLGHPFGEALGVGAAMGVDGFPSFR